MGLPESAAPGDGLPPGDAGVPETSSSAVQCSTEAQPLLAPSRRTILMDAVTQTVCEACVQVLCPIAALCCCPLSHTFHLQPFPTVQTDEEAPQPQVERIISVPCGPRPPNSRAVIVASTSARGRKALAGRRRPKTHEGKQGAAAAQQQRSTLRTATTKALGRRKVRRLPAV